MTFDASTLQVFIKEAAPAFYYDAVFVPNQPLCGVDSQHDI